jgi:hypothetical protein
MTVDALAGELGLWPGDVRTVMAALGACELTDEIAADVRLILNRHSERTVPEFYGQTGRDI